MNQGLIELVCTEFYIFSILLRLLNGCEHHILVLIGRILELGRLNRLANPFLGICICSGGNFLTAKFVFATFLRILYPLVVFYSAMKSDSLCANAKLIVAKRVLGCC